MQPKKILATAIRRLAMIGMIEKADQAELRILWCNEAGPSEFPQRRLNMTSLQQAIKDGSHLHIAVSWHGYQA
ncbi:MAG TPA: hypothetical protein VK463_12050 [Desulfomonilaceae bacterium]|nr:hypothetical protein [Desulfomonilaceae bacterium]